MIVDDATLDALADGELPPDEAARIEAAAASDPVLAARIARVRRLRSLIGGAYEGVLTEPPPERLLAAIQEGQGAGAHADVISLAERRTRTASRVAPILVQWGALAASIVLAFGAGGYLLQLRPSPISVGGSGALSARGVLAAGLEQQLAATQSPDAPVKIGVSYQADDGRYCRTFIFRGATAGLACRDRAGWQVVMAMQSPAAEPGQYRTAGDEIPAPVMEAVDRTIRGRPLDAAAERQVRDAGWGQRPRG